MSLSDRIFRPFETLIRPLDIPYRPMPSSGPFAVLLHFARMFRGVLATVAVLSVCVELINLAVIWGVSFVVDGVTRAGAAPFLSENWPALAIIGVLMFPVQPLIIFVTSALSSLTLAVCMPVAMQWQGHKAVERQDLAFFHDLFAGQVASRIGQVSNAVRSQVAVVAQSLPHFLVQIIGSTALLGALSLPLTAPVVVWTIANVLLAVYAVPRYSETGRKTARARSMVSGAMTDIYSNIQMVKLFAAEDSEAGMMRRTMQKTIETQHQERRVMLVTDTAVLLLNVALWLAIFGVGIWGLVDGFVTAGDFVASVAIVQRLSANARAVLSMGQQIFEAVGTLRDAMPIMTTPPTITDRADAGALTVKQGEIAFDRVGFDYRSGKQVIRDLSLTIAPGEKVGLVGLSGAGKTTLINLLLRFFDIKSGAIRIDGQDIREITQASLRANIGVITQDVSLLHRSVGDNIRYGRPGATADELEQAAVMAEAHSFIAELRDGEGRTGYDAFVGDRGIKLSGGQRQRVAIARVLLKNAPILVLDEATSALDSEAEAAIQDNLGQLMQGKTVIAIAHRLSTISEMDRIVVLDKGQIVEQGPPAELLARDGLYARLWKRQTGGFIPEVEEAV